jgi:hypothetical protein
MRFTPTPSAAETIAYEYVSKYWCGDLDDTTPTQSRWAVDTDEPFLDAELMTLGCVWRFLRARGLDYSEAFRTYEDAVVNRMAHDGGQAILDLANVSEGGVSDPTIADGNWSIS